MTARKTGPKKKTGRPSTFTPEIGDLICAGLAAGRSMRSICTDAGMPDPVTVYRWLRANDEFCKQYARARADGADALVDDMLAIADETTGDYVDDGEGKTRLNPENIQRSRLRVETRKWAAAKLKPKKYGERLDLSHGVQEGNPLGHLIQRIQGTALNPVGKLRRSK